MSTTVDFRFPALEFNQGDARTLYAFSVPGRDLSQFVTVSRIRRDDDTNVAGYQRPEVLSHIAEIRDYLKSDGALLPNAVVIAFDKRVRFEPQSGGSGPYGSLVIPVDMDGPVHERPGWMVDGQQRMAALQAANVPNFDVCAVGFIAETDEEQREQFILVNSTKPLPRSLIYELLPVTNCRLPRFLKKRQFPARLLERLNYDEDSPLWRRVRTPTNPKGGIKDNSVLRMIENSLTEGALYRYRDPLTGERLTHGAGIVSMGYVMDAIADRHRREGPLTRRTFIENLKPLIPACRWTDGFWDFGPGAQRRWNEIQNTSKDIQLLTNYLMVQYKTLVWDHAVRSPHRSHRSLSPN